MIFHSKKNLLKLWHGLDSLHRYTSIHFGDLRFFRIGTVQTIHVCSSPNEASDLSHRLSSHNLEITTPKIHACPFQHKVLASNLMVANNSFLKLPNFLGALEAIVDFQPQIQKVSNFKNQETTAKVNFSCTSRHKAWDGRRPMVSWILGVMEKATGPCRNHSYFRRDTLPKLTQSFVNFKTIIRIIPDESISNW